MTTATAPPALKATGLRKWSCGPAGDTTATRPGFDDVRGATAEDQRRARSRGSRSAPNVAARRRGRRASPSVLLT
jgi:hypothetical protein